MRCKAMLVGIVRHLEVQRILGSQLSVGTTEVANGWEEVESQIKVVCDRHKLIPWQRTGIALMPIRTVQTYRQKITQLAQ